MLQGVAVVRRSIGKCVALLKGTLLLLSIWLVPNADAQHWLDKFAGAQADHIADLVADDSGNAYVIGDFSLSMSMSEGGDALGTVSSAGGRDAVVAKMAPDGSLLWARAAGGGGVDLGLKLALGPAGLAVTGIFTGTANLFGTVVSSQGGSTDLFTALLDPATGNALWVRTAGGPVYTDTPAGITIDPAGNVVVVGKFKGSAVFGTDTLHSAFDPWTNALGFDAFIASWSSTGDYQWVRQGSGPHDDQAVDVTSSPNGMLYITGQFSDTITFQVQHPNISLNSIFVIAFDALGNEQWFRKCGGSTFNQVSDILFSSDNDLLLTGDVANTMFWVANTATPIPNADPHAYFILRVDTSGTLLNAGTMGSISQMHAASIAEQADSVVVYGEFECSFTGLQNAYSANGLFMATGLKDLFIAKHLSTDLSFVEAQQFGGVGAKRAGAITTVQDELLFAGSFDQYLFLPRGGTFWGDPVYTFPSCSYIGANGGLTYCGDPYYGNFAWAAGSGLSDGFLTKGYEEERQPYDWWSRQGTPPCDRSDRSAALCIIAQGLACPDSVADCGLVLLYSSVPFPKPDPSFCPFATTVGPATAAFWSNGFPQEPVTANYTGWYHYIISSANSCQPYRDSIYVEIHPAPTATVSDSAGVFTDDPLPMIYQSCVPLLMWATQFAPTDEVFWTVGTDTTFSDTIHLNATATYRLHLVSANGCSKTYSMGFTLLGNPFPNITGVSTVFAAGDTLTTCAGDCIGGNLVTTWFIDGVEAPLPNNLHLRHQLDLTCTNPNPPVQLLPYPNSPIQWSAPNNGPGWYVVHFDAWLDGLPCDSTVYTFSFTDSIYVIPGELAQFTASNAFRCVGDTVAIPYTCSNCDSTAWTGPGIVWTSANGDSIRVDQDGYYYFHAFVTTNGQTCNSSSYRTVSAPPPPPIYMQPYFGVICPNDSVLLYTVGNATAYSWSGPGITVFPNNDSLWVDEPGDYYLTVTHYPGCTSTNGPRTVVNFSSPFIEALPTGTICLNGSVELQVAAGPGSTVQWQAPLSGFGLTQTVNAPGTYYCTVSSCGIDWSLSYTVQASAVSAELDTTAYFLCQNEPLVLTAPPGGNIYQWLPSGNIGQELTVTVPGEYQLVVLDVFGCSDTSSVITVLAHLIAQPATATGDTVCAGQLALLYATGSGDLFWYANADTSQLLSTGSSWSFVPTMTDTVYVLQVEDGCPGTFTPAVVDVLPAPPTPTITGDGAYCTGEDIVLVATAPGGGTVLWNTPMGTVQGNTVGPLPADANTAGLYSCVVIGTVCNSDTASAVVTVLPTPGMPNVPEDALLCIGDTLVLSATLFADQAIWITPTGMGIDDPLTILDFQTSDAGEYLCHLLLGACSGDTASILVIVDPCLSDDEYLVIPNIFTPNGDGTNDVFTLTSTRLRLIELSIYNRWGQLVSIQRGKVVTWDGRASFSGMPCSGGVYYYVVEATTITGEPFLRTGYVHLTR